MKHIRKAEHSHADTLEPRPLQHWREALLNHIIPSLIWFGAGAVVMGSLLLLLNVRSGELASTILRVILYTLAYSVTVLLVYQQRLSLTIRAGIPLVCMYSIAVIELSHHWFGRTGLLLAFVVITLTMLFFGVRKGLYLLMGTTALLLFTGLAPWLPWLNFPFEQFTVAQPIEPIYHIVFFVFAVMIVIIPTSYLLQSLEASLTQSQTYARSAEEAASRTAQQAQELAARNARLEEVEQELRVSMTQTERRLRHIQALQRIDQAMAAKQDMSYTLDVALTQVIGELHVDAAAAWLANPVANTLDFVAARGTQVPVDQSSHAMSSASYVAQVARERQMISTQNGHHPRASNNSQHHSIPVTGAWYGIPLIARDEVKGVLEIFHREPLHPNQEWVDFLHVLAGQTAIAIDHAELLAELQRTNDELILAYDATIMALAYALEFRDAETEGHSRRVTELTLQLARAFGFSGDELTHIGRGAILHDIGKLAIPDAILLKPGPLTEEEYALMQHHTIYAQEMLDPIPFLQPVLDIPYCHHEKWDGSGYPRRLHAEEIPLPARIFAVIDVYDALRSDRPYRPRWPEEEVRSYLAAQAGSHFDPTVVHVFLNQVVQA